VGIVPVSHLPKIDRALDEALAQAGTDVLGDVVVRFELVSLPFVYARACYAVDGVPR